MILKMEVFTTNIGSSTLFTPVIVKVLTANATSSP